MDKFDPNFGYTNTDTFSDTLSFTAQDSDLLDVEFYSSFYSYPLPPGLPMGTTTNQSDFTWTLVLTVAPSP